MFPPTGKGGVDAFGFFFEIVRRCGVDAFGFFFETGAGAGKREKKK